MQKFIAHDAPHIRRQGASATRSGATPATTSQGQPNQSAATPREAAARTRFRGRASLPKTGLERCLLEEGSGTEEMRMCFPTS